MAIPLEIKIALHYWTNQVEDYAADDERLRPSPIVVLAMSAMVTDGLLVLSSSQSRTHEAGPALEAYVKALMAVPFPVQQWVIPKTDAKASRQQNAAWSVDHVPSPEGGPWHTVSTPTVKIVDGLGERYCGVVETSKRKPKTPTA